MRSASVLWAGRSSISAADRSGLVATVSPSAFAFCFFRSASRSQISRLLDSEDGNVTLSNLQRAAEMLGRKVRLELV